MAWIQSDLDKLDKALATGVTTVAFRDRTVSYRSLDEMLRLRSRIVSELQSTSGTVTERVQRVSFDKGTSQTTETRRAITILRGRHRELVRNNGYVSAAINETVSLTIGDGLQPVARGGTDEQRKLAQELMLEWAKSTFIDVDGLLDLFGLQALMMRTETEGGEGLALKRIRKIPGIRVPLQIRVLEGDYLDHTRDGTIDGRRVVMGVAFGPELEIGRLDVYGNVGRWRRQMIIPQFCKRVEAWFIEAAYLAGYDLTGITFDWVPPRSEILNLRDDIPALIKQARGGFGSMFSLLRSLGHPDPREVLQEIAECNQLLDDLGIVLDSDPRRTTAGGQLQPEEVEPPPPNDPDSGALDEA